MRVHGSYIALVIRFPADRDLAREIARVLELQLGTKVTPIARTVGRHPSHYDLRIHGDVSPAILHRAHRTIEGFRPPRTSRAPASD